MRITVMTGWTFAMLALIAMLIGHMGQHDLSWISNHISTFAAKAPNDVWITAAMIASIVALGCISFLISRYQILGTNYPANTLPILIGVIISGLGLVAAFEETASSIDALKNSSFIAIRRQSFHDAGLLVFFYGSICLTMVSGLCCTISRRGTGKKIIGVIITCLGPIAFFLMTTPWPKLVGVTEPSAGLMQRASLLCIWISMALLLSLASNISNKINRRRLRF